MEKNTHLTNEKLSNIYWRTKPVRAYLIIKEISMEKDVSTIRTIIKLGAGHILSLKKKTKKDVSPLENIK